jgi:hypothetical protein
VLGIARFGPEKSGDQPSALQDTLPRLIASNLKSLPIRRTPAETAVEIAALASLRSHFSAGADLASKLDARAVPFFDSSLDADARKDKIAQADNLVAAAVKKLNDADIVKESDTCSSTELATKFWEGYAKGQLIDTPSSGLGQAARAAKVDLLVTGTVAIQSGYAIVLMNGFDAALNREVFSWKSFCSVDDPSPLAKDLAARLERWVAGRDFARLDLNLGPAFAELNVNGKPYENDSPVIYVYRDESVRLEVSASGYSPRITTIDLTLGDRKSLDLELEPLVTGHATLSTDPQDAAISLDSVPIGKSPVSITLDGSRGIAAASAEGREPQTLVLPSSGESEMSLSLPISDGLGPNGRIKAAKDTFLQSLGWFVVSVPVTALTWGVYNGYSEAYLRSIPPLALTGNPSLYASSNASYVALWTAAAAAGTTATILIIRLVKYLAATR